MSNEKHTRKKIIDQRLKQAGWNVGDHTQVIEEFDIIVDSNLVQEAPTPYVGHQFGDYVLLGKDGKPLAVVEAKKTSVDAAIGREQAKQYSGKIFRFIYSKPQIFIGKAITVFGFTQKLHTGKGRIT